MLKLVKIRVSCAVLLAALALPAAAQEITLKVHHFLALPSTPKSPL